MRTFGRVGSVLLAAGLAGCVLPPPPPPPLVALPGPGKTEAQFQADDTACRATADASPPAGTTIEVPAAPTAPPTRPAAPSPPQAVQTQTVQVTPGMVYLRCMTAHNNVVEPLAPTPPVYYGFYAPYPVYYGFGDIYPWLYGDAVGFGFYGGWGYGGRWGGHWGGGYWGGRWAGGRGGGGWRR